MMCATTSAFGLAAIDAYLAYNDSNMLGIAEQMWNQAVTYQLNAADAQIGFSSAQNVKVSTMCGNGERHGWQS